jgi:hypothetical protein
VVITGTGYASGAAATFSGTGITINSTTFNSATQVTANVTLAANATVGARNITVTNSDGGVGTGTGIFTVTANQQNTGYLLGSGTPTTANTWTAPSSWFTNEAPPTASTQVAQVAVTSGSSPAPTVLFKGFSLGGATSASSIDKICVLIDNNSIVTSGTGTQRFAVALTWDGGTSFTTENAGMTDLTLTTFTGTDYYFKDQSTAPGTSDPTTTCTTWGRTWSAAEMSSANFGIRVKATNSNGTSRTIRFDTAQVKVYYTP